MANDLPDAEGVVGSCDRGEGSVEAIIGGNDFVAAGVSVDASGWGGAAKVAAAVTIGITTADTFGGSADNGITKDLGVCDRVQRIEVSVVWLGAMAATSRVAAAGTSSGAADKGTEECKAAMAWVGLG